VGLVTINQPREKLERIVAAFSEGGGEGWYRTRRRGQRLAP
jgi:hypothetical protein